MAQAVGLPSGGLERLNARARLLHDALRRHLATLDDLSANGAQRAAAKQIAVVTLGLEVQCGARRRMALGVAASTVARNTGLGEGMLRKAASEARALLDYGLRDMDPIGVVGAGVCTLVTVEQLDAMVDAVNLRDATTARAMRFGDARRDRDRTQLDVRREIERLLRRGAEGDVNAARLLRGLARRLQAWM